MDLNKLKEILAVVFDMDGLMFDSERYADYLRVTGHAKASRNAMK